MTATTSDSQKARDNFLAQTPSYRREFPPRINPDTGDMIRQIWGGYEKVEGHLAWLEDEFGRLVHSGLIDAEAGCGLQQDCERLSKILYDSTWGATRIWHRHDPHLIADRAKYCAAVLMHQLAQMQYHVGELATLGRLDRKANRSLQFQWFGKIVYAIQGGIVEATMDRSVDWTIEGGDFLSAFYRDGRKIATIVDLNLPRGARKAIWPNDKDLCGDGPIYLHPRGTLCHIEPVERQGFPEGERITIDIGYLLRRYAAAKVAEITNRDHGDEPAPYTPSGFTVDLESEAALNAAMLEMAEEDEQ